MSRLYPPNIEGTIPAFTTADGRISVPYSMNKTVSESDYIGLKLILKSVQSNRTIFYLDSMDGIEYNRATHIANFSLGTITQNDSTLINQLKIGNYYKVQLAYVDINNNPGYYSTVGIVKYTGDPELTIEGLADGSNTARVEYVGHYKQITDPTEKVYQYKFNLYGIADTTVGDYVLIASSDWQLHNSDTDIDSYESIDKYSFTYTLEPNIPYKVEYVVRTNNLLERSIAYNVIEKQSIRPEISADLKCKMNFEEAYVELYLKAFENTDNHISNNGAFILLRSSSEDNFTNWYELQRFSLRSVDNFELWSFKDFTIEQGMTYQYALQQYNTYGLRSSRLIATDSESNSTYITVDFEDMFLFDGERQLKIRFNPKVSSFKTTILEQKQDTIGSQYPFFFRNGKVSYKEFPIAGLLSYWLDGANFFIDDEKLGLSQNPVNETRFLTVTGPETARPQLEANKYSVGYDDYSITAERKFKLEVLDWLNNGLPKLFKSPTEGNYLVRLMNVSLTPEDTLGRLIHNFQATAYEIDNHLYPTLLERNIITIQEPSEMQYRLRRQPISKFMPPANAWVTVNTDDENNVQPVYEYVKFVDILPGTLVRFDGGDPIQIGVTGSLVYYKPTETINTVEVYLDEKKYYAPTGLVEYQHYPDDQNLFEQVADIIIESVPYRSFIGHKIIINTHEDSDEINNVKRNLISLRYVHFSSRHIEVLKIKSGQRYSYDERTRTISDQDPYNEWNPDYIYKIYNEFDLNYNYYIYNEDNNQLVMKNEPKRIDYSINFNGEKLYLYPNDEEELINHLIQGQFGDYHIDYLEIGDGIKLDCAYNASVIIYNMEKDDNELTDADLQNYLNTHSELIALDNNDNIDIEQTEINKANDEGYLALLEQKLYEE